MTQFYLEMLAKSEKYSRSNQNGDIKPENLTKNNKLKYRHMTLRLIVITLFLCLSTAYIQGQTPINYYYDEAGNRYLRSITMGLKSAKVDSVLPAKSDKTEVLRDNIGEHKILIYPNPTQGQLRIDIQGTLEGLNSGIYFYNISGNLIIRKSPIMNLNELNLSGCPIGTYLLKIVVGDNRIEWKIIKE